MTLFKLDKGLGACICQKALYNATRRTMKAARWGDKGVHGIRASVDKAGGVT